MEMIRYITRILPIDRVGSRSENVATDSEIPIHLDQKFGHELCKRSLST